MIRSRNVLGRLLFSRTIRFSSPLSKVLYRQFSSPSLESMQAFLLSPKEHPGQLRVVEVLGDEVVRIPTMDGVGVGSMVEVGTTSGIVIQFDKYFTTVGLLTRGRIAAGSHVRVLDEDCFKFRVASEKMGVVRTNRSDAMETTGSSVLDFLLGPVIPRGITIALYGVSGSFNFAGGSSSNVIRFPSEQRTNLTGFGLYVDLINCGNKALQSANDQVTTLVVDLRHFEDACKSIQFQSHAPLPVSPVSLIASILQLANGQNLSVIVLGNSSTDFDNELERSADLGVRVPCDKDNMMRIVRRFVASTPVQSIVRKCFLEKLIERDAYYSEMRNREKQFQLYTDYWEKEEMDSIETVWKLLPYIGEERLSERDNLILMRAMTILHFNKTSKSSSADIRSFPRELLHECKRADHRLYESIQGEVTDGSMLRQLDQCLVSLRNHLDLTSV